MFCYKCGKELPDDSKFCYECGSKIINTAPSEHTPATPCSQTTSVQSANITTHNAYQQYHLHTPQTQPIQQSYISKTAAKSKPKSMFLIIGVVIVVVAILFYALFTNGNNISTSFNIPSETPQKDSSHDSVLIGKWRSRNGDIIELNSDGSASTNIIDSDNDILMFSKYFPSLKHTADNPVWESENG